MEVRKTSEYYNKARELLKVELDRLKAQGLKTYINKSEDSCYGLATDGINVVHINHELCHTFSLSYAYIPQKGYGSGVTEFSLNEGKSNLSRADFMKAVAYGKDYALRNGIRRYKNFDDYVRHEGPWFNSLYVEY